MASTSCATADTRAQVLGLEAVLGTGAVVSHLGGLVKDNTGYHWPGLLTGSEGTLGVVTAARLRLVPTAAWHTTAILAFAAVADALEAASLVRRSLPSLDACELFFEDGVRLVCSVTGMPPPFAGPHPVCLLLEAADRTDPTGALGEVTTSLPHVLDTVVATEPGPRAALWRYREGHTEAINTLGAPHKLDVTLPQTLTRRVHRPGRAAWWLRSIRTRRSGSSATWATATSTST